MANLNFKECRFCRKPFPSYRGERICNACIQQIDDDFVKIRDYIYDNPGKTGVEKLAKETEISEEIIMYLIQQGRLEFEGAPSAVCSGCSKPVTFGESLCEACKTNLASQLNDTLPKAPEPSTPAAGSDPRRSRMYVDFKNDRRG